MTIGVTWRSSACRKATEPRPLGLEERASLGARDAEARPSLPYYRGLSSNSLTLHGEAARLGSTRSKRR